MQRACAWATIIVLLGSRFVSGQEGHRAPNRRDVRQAAIDEFKRLGQSPPQAGEARQFGRISRILDVLAQEGISLASTLGGDDSHSQAARQGLHRAFSAARKTAADSLATPTDRVAAVRILGRGPDSREDVSLLTSLLIPQTPLSVQLAVVDAIARLPHAATTEALLSGWTKHGPKVHAAVVSVLLWREPWLGALDESAATRPELVAALDWTRRDIALRHPSAEIRSRAERMRTAPPLKPEIRKALDKFSAVPGMQGNPARGKQIFTEATCANCHMLEGVGRHVGPDLSQLVDRSLRSLLVDTIDPNRVVDHRFIEYTVVTASGQQVSGMLFDEEEDSITLADANGELRMILRKDLDDLASNYRSQMPEGLEARLTPEQMADLLVFIASSRGRSDKTP
jgi:putative heme-binding domain-containing protein